MKAYLYLFLISFGLSACAAPGKPLEPVATAGKSADESFDPSPYDEDWPVPEVNIVHEIPESLTKVENVKLGDVKARARNGFRVQLFAGLSQSSAKEVYNEAYNWWTTVGKTVALSTDSTDVTTHSQQGQAPVFLDYEQPNYKVRIGNFVSREEAKEFSTYLDGAFNSHFIIPARILR